MSRYGETFAPIFVSAPPPSCGFLAHAEVKLLHVAFFTSGMVALAARTPSIFPPPSPAKARWRIFAPCEERNSWVLSSGRLASLFNQMC